MRHGIATGPVALHINVDTEEFPTSAIPDFWRQRQPILKETAMAGGYVFHNDN